MDDFLLLNASVNMQHCFNGMRERFTRPPFLTPRLRRINRTFNVYFVTACIQLSLVPSRPFSNVILGQLRRNVMRRRKTRRKVRTFSKVKIRECI